MAGRAGSRGSTQARTKETRKRRALTAADGALALEVHVDETAKSRLGIEARGYTVRDLCGRYRVGAGKVRAWIAAGELSAINTAPRLAKPRFVITPDQLVVFETGRQAAQARKVARRRRRQSIEEDFYPD
ncbi:MAG TPA: hypothetical protein VK395_29800 [Gemmataceae bacterium]|nr:hypothetical protein [Gemmataceae bacterium]